MDDQEHVLVKCRVCASAGLAPILDFGDMPLANAYGNSPHELTYRAPLEVLLCTDCGCVQLAHTIEPLRLYNDYLYTSSTSGSLAEHFRAYARDTSTLLALPPNAFVVGIGGNDGPLESAYQALGYRVLNVEAAGNVAALSRAAGVPTLHAWFNGETAQRIAQERGLARLITCNNCFAHMPDIHGAVRAIKLLLAPDGCFVCENAYWMDAVRGNHFDAIYHEHVFYWTLKALAALFGAHAMTITAAHFNGSQGGSIRVFVQHAAATRRSNWVRCAIEREESVRLFAPSTYDAWRDRIEDWQQACLTFLAPLDSLACYGVPAKFTMLSEQLGWSPTTIRYAVEDSPIKVGRFTPGARIPIVSRERFVADPPAHCIITAANYAERIVALNPQFKGRWIVLLPEPRFL